MRQEGNPREQHGADSGQSCVVLHDVSANAVEAVASAAATSVRVRTISECVLMIIYNKMVVKIW